MGAVCIRLRTMPRRYRIYRLILHLYIQPVGIMVNCTLALKIVYALSSIPVVDTFIFFNIKLIKHKSWSFPVSPGQSWSFLVIPGQSSWTQVLEDSWICARNGPI